MKAAMEDNYDALVSTIESICDLRGITVTAVYLRSDMMDWVYAQNAYPFWRQRCVEWERGHVVIGKTKSGNEKVTMQPYGATKPIPVKGKYSGATSPWKVVCALRED